MPNHSDLYKEYNKVRKQILMQARYYNIEKPVFPTAKQLGREVQSSDIQILKTTKQLYIQPIKMARKVARIPKTNINLNIKVPKKRKISAKQAYKRYGTRFTAIDQEGNVIDKISGEKLGHASTITEEEIGKHIKSEYESTGYERPRINEETAEVLELEMFKKEIEARLSAAAQDMLYGLHGSQKGVDEITTAFQQFKELLESQDEEDLKAAYEQYRNMVDEIRQALDEALYYSQSEQDHLRAIRIATDLLSLKKTKTDFNAQDYDIDELDLNYFEDYQYGRLYKYTKYSKEEVMGKRKR